MFLLSRFNTRVNRNALIKLGSEVVARVASFGLVLLAARTLGEANFGRYNYGLALGFVLAQIADFGLQMLLAREIAVRGKEARPLVQAALQLKIFLSIPMLLLLWLLTAGNDPAIRLALLLLGLTMLGQTYLEFAAYVFRGRQELLVEAQLLAGARLLTVALGGVILAAGGGLVGLALASLLSVTILVGWSLRLLRKTGWLNGKEGMLQRAAWRRYGQLARQAFPLGVAIFLSIAYTRLAVLLLQIRQGEVAVAAFSAAHRLVEPAQIVPASLLAAVFPAFSHAWHRDPARARRLGWQVSVGLALLGTGAAATFWLTAEWLIPFLYGANFAGSIPVLRLLAFSAIPAFINYSLTHYLIARDQQRIIGLFTGLMLILHAGLSWWWIPRWGALGPAAAIIAAEVVLFICCVLALAVSQPEARRIPGEVVDVASAESADPDPAGAIPPL